MKKTIYTISKIVCAVILVGLLISTIHWQDVFATIIHANGLFVGLFVVLYAVGIAISAHKWHVLGKHMHFTQPYFFYLKTYLLGTFLNNFFPSFVGGDAYRTLALGKRAGRTAESMATVVVDRITGLVVIVCLALLCGGVHYQRFVSGDEMAFMIGGVSVCFAVCVYLTSIGMRTKKMPACVQKYRDIFAAFRTGHILSVACGYATIFSFVGIACANYMLFVAFHVDISVIDYMSVIFLTNLIASLPISVGNIGTKEWAYIFLFGLFGMHSSALVAIVLVSRVLQMLVSFCALPLYLRHKDDCTV